MSTPRGIRNHNPGNIRKSATPWQGQAGDDGAFVIFGSAAHGIRAMAKIILNYQKKHHLNTLRKIIHRWAPPNENDTSAYVSYVATKAGIEPDATIAVAGFLPRIIPAMIQMENGCQPYDDETIAEGIRLAVSK